MKNYCVIGGTSGIGEQLVKVILEKGQRVVFFGSNRENGRKIEDEHQSENCKYRHLNLLDDDAFHALSASIDDDDHYDACINLAGVMYLSRLPDLELQDWVDMARVNYIGTLNVVAAFMKKMHERSRFINVSSVAALNPAPGNAAYAASKAASDIFINNFRKECAHTGPIFSNLHLGGVDTEINRKIRNKNMRRTIEVRSRTYDCMNSYDVALQIYDMCNMPKGVNIADMFLSPSNQPD